MEANAVKLEGDDSERSRLVLALIKVTAVFCHMRSCSPSPYWISTLEALHLLFDDQAMHAAAMTRAVNGNL